MEKGMVISGMAGGRNKPSARHATLMHLPVSFAKMIDIWKGLVAA
jgi:hypothetical protein